MAFPIRYFSARTVPEMPRGSLRESALMDGSLGQPGVAPAWTRRCYSVSWDQDRPPRWPRAAPATAPRPIAAPCAARRCPRVWQEQCAWTPMDPARPARAPTAAPRQPGAERKDRRRKNAAARTGPRDMALERARQV